jgi:hypothetical protein
MLESTITIALPPVNTASVKIQPHSKTLINPHILRDKSLEMKNHLASRLTPMFVKRRPLDHLWLQLVVRLGYEFPGEGFEDCGRVDTVGEEVVELGADL